MREKMIEILNEIHRKPMGKTYAERLATIADSLISNGVTIPIRCKDCRYCQHDSNGFWCFNDYEHNLQPDDFCSYGERKTDG